VSDVVFVQMPFAGLERPSLALGLFTAALRQAGISTESVYGNIGFAEKVGLPVYFVVAVSAPTALLGEWLFAEAAFGEDAARLGALSDPGLPTDTTFVDAVVRYRNLDGLGSLLAATRAQAAEYVEELADQIVATRPRIVACTSMFDQHCASLALLRAVKRRDPRVFTVLGGANCAGPMGRAIHRSFPALDFTVTGEFDAYVVGFVKALLAADGEASRVGALPPNTLGPADREAPAGPLPTGAILTDMDQAPVPDYDDYFAQIYESPLSRYVIASIPLETSRGCWWGAKQHCTFCGLNAEGMAFRRKSPQRALDEIRALTTRYGADRFAATDNIIDMSYFQTVLPGLAADSREYSFFYETKANLKREHVQALADAGCRFIQPGIESLHDETLRMMKKGITACQNIQLLKHCLELGVTPAWNVLCGLPGSDPEWVAQIAEELPSLVHLPPPSGTSPVNYDRFSPYQQKPETYGLVLEAARPYREIYPLGADVLDDLAYYFDPVGGTPPRVLETARLSRDVCLQWRTRFWTGTRPELVRECDDGEAIRIRDTRGVPTTHELRGLAAELLRIVEAPISWQGILAALRSRALPVEEAEVTAALDDLRERALVWRSATQYVSLATAPPVAALRPTAETALGRVDIQRYFTEKVRFALALSS
jgi:ribosomal peptide maturation radical SAM protein 1